MASSSFAFRAAARKRKRLAVSGEPFPCACSRPLTNSFENRSAHKSQVAGREIRQVREDRRQIRVADPEPRRHRRRVLVQRSCWNPTAVVAGIVRAAERERREISVERIALYRAAQNQLMVSPRMIGAAVRARLQRATEFGQREGGHVVGYAEFLCRLVE